MEEYEAWLNRADDAINALEHRMTETEANVYNAMRGIVAVDGANNAVTTQADELKNYIDRYMENFCCGLNAVLREKFPDEEVEISEYEFNEIIQNTRRHSQ